MNGQFEKLHALCVEHLDTYKVYYENKRWIHEERYTVEIDKLVSEICTEIGIQPFTEQLLVRFEGTWCEFVLCMAPELPVSDAKKILLSISPSDKMERTLVLYELTRIEDNNIIRQSYIDKLSQTV